MAIEWRPAMAIDNAALDDDHRYLIGLINSVEALCQQSFDQGALLKILGSLKYYTVYHFVREEAAQRAAGFPHAEAHALEHKQLIATVDQAVALVSQEITPDKHERIRAEITALLNGWLIQHIIKHDIPMRPYVRNIRAFMGRAAPLSTV
ncbi:MAG: bacteriohemerythrin [Rhodospirillaceae bacterium]